MAVRELTETELEVFEEELAAAAQTLESREERMQEVLSRTTNINLILFTSGCSLVRDANTAHGRHATATGKVRQKGFLGGVNISS